VLKAPPDFEHLLVYDVSRWGRFQDIDESAYYEHLCKRAGVRVTYVAEPFLAEPGPMTNLIKAMKRTMAAEYSRELSVKSFVSHMRLASMGYCQGGVPNYGLSRLLVDGEDHPIQLLKRGERKAIAVDRIKLAPGPPHEVAIVRLIFHLFVNERLNETRIAERLSASGVSPPIGRRWHPWVINSLLKNERYIGAMVWNRTCLKMRQPRKKNPPAEWVRKEGAHEAIVDSKLFADAKAIFDARRPPKPRSKTQMLNELRALFLREGRLSASLIAREKGMASIFTYIRRFGTLEKAYRLVGCPPSPQGVGGRRRPGAHQARLEFLAQKLRDLLQRHGRITGQLIRDEQDFPPVASFAYSFGSLRDAYAYIGYQALPPGPPAKRSRDGVAIMPVGTVEPHSADGIGD
jgi:DNA invertase Pin-like site-specific DNA recombinase